ncbi:uncharacterized protein LOC127749959 [Frankliniella occidentalis]|uniref:Uncharacterized protein LOC127749959 n=1 Tax=Frankliniella occidentalis TaxID=133901 RepID=A0A9C6X0P7_FRAOC|nr:uncharacterized protein LOC127749959 [Frankliniella occidentalis]
MASRQASSAVTSSSSSGSHPTTSETTTQEYNPIKNFPSTPKLPNKKKAAESLGTSVAVVKDIVKSSEKGSHSTTNDMETQNNEKNSFDLLFSEDLEIGKDIWSEDVDKGKDILSEDDDKDKDEVTYDGSGERLETQDDQMDLNRTWEMTNINPAQNEELIQAITGIIKGASSIVPESTCKDIANHLVVNIALEDVSDLAIVEPAWLSTFNLKPGPLKKIMIAFSGEDKKQPEKPKEKPNVKKGKDKSLMRTQPALDNPIPSRPALSDKISTTDVKKMGFDFPIAWGNMKNSLLTSLEKEQVPSKEDRESMVLTISKDLMAAYEALKKRDPSVTQKHPGRPRYKEIVRVIFKDFKKCFQDTLNEEVVGDGDFTLIDQIETCVENIYRTSSVNKSNATERAKGLRAASCILPHKYCPPMTKAEKKAAEETRLQLLILFKGPKSEWDWNNIKSKLLASLPAQRAILTSPKRTIDDVTEKWPFLFEYQGSLCHLNAITGVDVLENFQDFVKDKLDDLISYLTLESPQRKKNVKINRAVVMVPEAQHTLLLAAVKMLVNHFDENLSDILLTAEETLLPHEVADELADLPATPCIVALEDSPFKAKTFYLCVEKTCINASLTNGLEALVALCAVFFNFGLLYPPKASTTMSYIESQMANLCDGKGIRKAQTEGGIVSRLAYTKLKELVNSVQEHSKEMLGDD